MKKNKQLLSRLLARKEIILPACPDVCWEGQLYHQVWNGTTCQRVGTSLGPCPQDPQKNTEIKPAEIATSPAKAIDPNSYDPPLICWKGKLYQQKWVDGGLEAYGDPIGDC